MVERARLCQARVAAVRALSPCVLEVDLDMEDPPGLPFAAGQWVSVPFGPKTVRAYSIASAPSSQARITLCADVVPGGIGSRWFRGLAPGAEVRFKGPLGGFVLPHGDRHRLLFVAEEIGIVPIRSILRDLDERGLDRPARLVCGARHAAELIYDAELRALARRQPAFAYHPVVGAPEAEWAGEHGDLPEVVDRLILSVEGLVAYVAGGVATIHAVRDRLVAKGMERKTVKWERFW